MKVSTKIINDVNNSDISRRYINTTKISDATIARTKQYDNHLSTHNLIMNGNTKSTHHHVDTCDLISNKNNKKIPKKIMPKRSFCLKRSLRNPDVGVYISLEDNWIDECQPDEKEKLIDFWQKRLYTSKEQTLSTLRNTTQMVSLLEAEHMRPTMRDFRTSRAPQLGSRRIKGTVYTDTAFASTPSIDGATAFQVFIHGSSSFLSIELLKSKRSVPSAIKNYARKYGIPNHIHGDRAREFLFGDSLTYCQDQAIRVTTTGELGKPHQNSRAENSVGIIKQLTFNILHKSQAPSKFWSYAMLYACRVWNATSKKRLKNCTPYELMFNDTEDLSIFRFPFFCHVEYRACKTNFPTNNGLKDGIYLGPVEGEGDPFAAYIFDVETCRVRTRSIYREKVPVQTTNNNCYKMTSSHHIPVDIYRDENHTQSIPNASEDAMPTVIDESRSFAIDLRTLSPSQSVLEYKDKDWRAKSTSSKKQNNKSSNLKGKFCVTSQPYICSL